MSLLSLAISFLNRFRKLKLSEPLLLLRSGTCVLRLKPETRKLSISVTSRRVLFEIRNNILLYLKRTTLSRPYVLNRAHKLAGPAAVSELSRADAQLNCHS